MSSLRQFARYFCNNSIHSFITSSKSLTCLTVKSCDLRLGDIICKKNYQYFKVVDEEEKKISRRYDSGLTTLKALYADEVYIYENEIKTFCMGGKRYLEFFQYSDGYHVIYRPIEK